MLLQLAQRPDLPIEQSIQAAQSLYESSSPGSEEERLAAQVLLQLAQRPDLPIEQSIQVAQSLYESSSVKSEEERLASEILWKIAQRPDATDEQRLKVANIFLDIPGANYIDIARSIQILLSLMKSEATKNYLEEHQQDIVISVNADVTDLPYLFELAQQELLPISVRNMAFNLLNQMIPQFGTEKEE